MTTYYIDPSAGSDSNNGTSWAQAFKTFRPIETRVVSPAAGDLIKIAKTDEEEVGITLDNVRLAEAPSSTSTNGLLGWTQPNLIVPGSLSTRLYIIHAIQGSTGWTNVDANRSQLFDASNGLTPSKSYLSIYTPSTNFVANAKLCYTALAATVNLSSFGRIEFKCGGIATGGATQQTLKLCLCSDAAGDTSLLEIPFNPSLAVSSIIAYEGTLPNGVNSISIRQDSTLYSSSNFMIQSLIATQVFSSSNYFGHFTLLKIGNHDGAVMAPVGSFAIISSNQVMQFYQCAVGPASLDNTTFAFRYYKTTSWASIASYNATTFTGTGSVFSNSVRDVVNDTKYRRRLLFNLADLQGASGNPIQIVGGYDPNTDTVTGRTRLMNRYITTHPSGTPTAQPAFAFVNTRYITIKNIETFTGLGGTFAFAETSYGIRFESCRFSSIRSHTAGLHAVLQRLQTDDVSVLYDVYFKDCVGDFYPQSNHAGDYTAGSYTYMPLGKVYNITIENGVICPYSGTGTVDQQQYAPNNIPVDIVGTLKCYCLGGLLNLNGTNTQGRMRFPAIKSGATGTLYLYGGGGMFVSPAPSPSQQTGAYTFPTTITENVSLFFYDTYGIFTLAVSGGTEFCYFPSITMSFTSTAWHSGVTASVSYSAETLFRVDPWFPPLWIQDVDLSGAPYSGFSTSYTNLVIMEQAQVQISNVTVTSTWNLVLLKQRNTSNPQFLGVYGPNLCIIDTFTHAARALAVSTYILNGGDGGSTAVLSGNIDLRNITYSNSSATYKYLIDPMYMWGAAIRFVGCNIQNTVHATPQPLTAFPTLNESVTTASRNYGVYGDCGLILEDSTISVGTAITTINDTVNDYSATPTSMSSWPECVSVINNTNNTHVLYWRSLLLEKDTSIYYLGPFSWKTTLRRRHTLPSSAPIPLGTVPVKLGNLVTISLRVRRSTATDCSGGLLVYHHGAAGYAAAVDLEEKLGLITAAANTWELVTVEFTVQRSTVIDIYFTHFGANGNSMWFDDLRVIEQ